MNRHLQSFLVWRRDKIDQLSKYKGAVAISCVVLLVIAMGTIVWSTRAEPPREMRTAYVYYFDLNTKDFFTHPLSEVAPIEAPSGPLASGAKAGVRAHVFACGSCENEIWVGYLSATRPLASAEKKQAEQGEVIGDARLIGNPETSMWHPYNSEDATYLINQECHDGQLRVECFPTADEIAAAQ